MRYIGKTSSYKESIVFVGDAHFGYIEVSEGGFDANAAADAVFDPLILEAQALRAEAE